MSLEQDLARIALQEARLRFPAFDAGTAWTLGSALRAEADRRAAGVAIDVSTYAQQLFHCATEGATPRP